LEKVIDIFSLLCNFVDWFRRWYGIVYGKILFWNQC